METETHVLASEKRAKLQSEIKSHREDINTNKFLLRREEKSFEAAKSQANLLGSSASVGSNAELWKHFRTHPQWNRAFS